jgi:hypothetical protein
MALPVEHNLTIVHLDCYSGSIGGSPVAAYLRIPFRCRIVRLAAVVVGTITTADCSVAVALNGTAISGSPFVIAVSGAAPGEVASMVPTANTYANADDYVSFTPSGASGSNVPATFSVAIQAV